MIKFLLALALCGASTISATATPDFNHYGDTEIKRFTVVGERCTGTNYVLKLLLRNFPDLTSTQKFGHKHFLWWFDAPPNEEKLSQIGYQTQHVELEGSDDCLFVFVTRDPYDWLRSFYRAPHHVHVDLLSQGFMHFISHTWKSQDTNHVRFDYHLLENLNPFTNHPFRNILELRNYKNRNYLRVGRRVKNFLVVSYETAAENPQKLLNYLSSKYHLKPSSNFVSVNSYKGEGIKTFEKKKYRPLSYETLTYINDNLDWELEKQLGYEKQKPKPWIYRMMKKIERKCRKALRHKAET